MKKSQHNNKTRICYIAGREESYTRTRLVIKALRQVGYEVITCLPKNKSVKNYPGLILKFFRLKKECDIVLVGFFGHLLMPWVRLLTRKPILFDMYICTYDIMMYDRLETGFLNFKAIFYYLADKISMLFADRIILETWDHINHCAKKFNINLNKFERILLTVDSDLIRPKNKNKDSNNFLVHFHGEFAPFHGIHHIVEAAKILENEDVEFRIIGTGITYEQNRALAARLNVKNIEFIDRVAYEELGDYMSQADICLGIFGDNIRAQQELTNKVIEALAVKKPLITIKNNSILELLQNTRGAILLENSNSKKIAAAIRKLKNNKALRDKIADNGYKVFLKSCGFRGFSRNLSRLIETTLRK